MRKTMIAIVTLAAALSFAAPARAGELDGTQWKIRPKGVRSLMFWERDELKFKNGQFTSVECIPFGFNPGPYSESKSGEGLTWKAEQTNSQGERMAWEGSRTGDKMAGSFQWTRKDGKMKTFKWKGKRMSHEHPSGKEHPTKEHPAKKEHPTSKEHPTGMEHPSPK